MSEIKVDTVAEKTSANGVTVDGLNIKDSKLVTSNSVVAGNITADAIDGTKIADNAIDSEHYTDASIDAAHLNADVITGATALTAEPADTDEFLISDAGTLRHHNLCVLCVLEILLELKCKLIVLDHILYFLVMKDLMLEETTILQTEILLFQLLDIILAMLQ